jgi:hypothetical protein
MTPGVPTTLHVPAPVADLVGEPGRSGIAWFLGTRRRSETLVRLLEHALAVSIPSEVRR